MTNLHATTTNENPDRNCILLKSSEFPPLADYAFKIAAYATINPIESVIVEKPDPTKYLSGNSVSISKLVVNGDLAFHAKLLKAPDAESVYLATVKNRYPEIVTDPHVLIPIVVDFVYHETVVYYLHITRWTAHCGTLAEVIVMLWMARRHVDLGKLLKNFGRFLNSFHSRYPKLHHNDMNPSNVLIVGEPSLCPNFVLVDCAGLDDEVGDDVGSFLLSMDVLADGGFGAEFTELARNSFFKGYRESSEID